MPKFKFEYKITIIYLLVGCAWIVFSDKLIHTLSDEKEVLTQMQTYKGWFYVAVTAILLFLMVKNHLIKIRRAQREAVKGNRLKSAFLQNISHEIRTPMNSIIGFSNLMEQESTTNKIQAEYAGNISKSCNQLLYIVDELMDISLIESGNIKVYPGTFNLNQLIDDIQHTFKPLIKSNIQFETKKGLTDELSNIRTDNSKLRKVISNLITNANKYSEKGTILLSYKVIGKEIQFCVSDNGMGIPYQSQPDVFERFHQANDTKKKLNDGIGLGLAISKGYVDLLGGKIGFESEPLKGSSFYFTIPYNKAQ